MCCLRYGQLFQSSRRWTKNRRPRLLHFIRTGQKGIFKNPCISRKDQGTHLLVLWSGLNSENGGISKKFPSKIVNCSMQSGQGPPQSVVKRYEPITLALQKFFIIIIVIIISIIIILKIIEREIKHFSSPSLE